MEKFKTKVAIYARTNNNCVESINHQISSMLSYIEKEEIGGLSGIYVDCGFSGIDKNRPEYNRLFNDVKTGKINTIIIYDVSRLSRNIFEIDEKFGEYIIEEKVNIIGITDGYISKENSIYKSFSNIIKDFYKRDMAAKRKATREFKKRNSIKKEV